MREHGKELSPQCIKALEDAGEVTPEEKAELKKDPRITAVPRLPARFSLNNSSGFARCWFGEGESEACAPVHRRSHGAAAKSPVLNFNLDGKERRP
jgi:hypothetical protein